MKEFWKRRLPALTLALLLTVGLAPPALAAHEHVFNQLVKTTETMHVWKCECGQESRGKHIKSQEAIIKEPTCYQAGVAEYTCSECFYSWQEPVPATGKHSLENTYGYDSSTHWQKCETPGCTYKGPAEEHSPKDNGVPHAPTCTADGYISYTCVKCQQPYVMKTADRLGHNTGSNGVCTRCGASTHNHSFSANWTTDANYHWHQCVYCTEVGSRALHRDGNNDGRCDTCGYGITNGGNNVAGTYVVSYYTGSGTSTESVVKGGRPQHVPVNPSMPSITGSHVFKGWIQGTTGYYAYKGQTLVSPASYAVNSNTSYSALYALRASGQNITLNAGTTSGKLIGGDVRMQVAAKFSALTGQSSFSSIRFTAVSGSGKLYATSSKAALGTGGYAYSDLSSYLYYVPSSSGSLTANYTASDVYGNEISGGIVISGSASSTDSANILYRVAPGGTVNFKTAHFEEAYRKLSGDSTSPRYVTFHPSSSYDRFDGALYAGGRAMDRERLDSKSFYITNDRYGGDYALDDVSFRADRSAKEGDELSMTFRVYYNSSNYYDATLRIRIDEDGEEGEVIYRVAPGGSVTFNRSDFNNAYRDVASSNRTIRYVEFDPDNSYTTFSGKISASGHADFTRNELAREQFNYTGTSYGDYALDDLVFRAGNNARDGDELEIPFWAYYSRDDYAECTLRIIIDKNGSQDTVTCNVAPGSTTRLNKSAFNDVYRALSEYNNRTIRAVSFDAPDSYKNFAGRLYVRNTELELSDLTHSKTWFYYSDQREGDYALDDLNFQADRSAKEGASLSIPFRAYYDSSNDYEEGILRINITSEANTITYEATPGGSTDFKPEDFNRAYQSLSGNGNRTIRYVSFEAGSDYASFAGSICTGGTPLNRSSLTFTQTQFYYSSSAAYGTYALNSLSFRPDATAKDKSTLTLSFRAYYDSTDYEEGTLKLVVNSNAGGDIGYTVTPGRTVNFDRVKFDDFFRKSYSSYSLEYVVFENPSTTDFPDAYGTLYTGYNTSYSSSLSRNSLRNVRFYYNAGDAERGDYALNDLTFAAASSFTSGKVILRFTAYGSGSRSVDGSVVITPTGGTAASSNVVGSVRYAVTTGTNIQINANDLARFYKSTYPSGTLQYVTLGDVPTVGSLYYNYYGASRYGTSAREQITASNRSRNFYLSPAGFGEYALSELTYVPSGSNYCASIPFTAYGTGGQSVSGAILISVTNKAVSEVYGPTPKNTAVTFPASSIAAAVAAATGTTPSGIQLLKLPAANVGTIYVGSSTASPANTTTVYGYNTGTQQLGQLRFVPASGYTGPVEIPYVALNASNTAIASGVFSMGVLESRKEFKDVTTSTWCYKYVVELASSGVIDGYPDGNFKPDNTITYGAALKLIMLAAGYPEQAPVNGGGTFSGYLAKAQSDGLVTRSNVNLSGPITRLQVAQLAAGALKLDINNLSSVKPFTDTADVYVQALNAAGIVEGYFNNGTSTFRPSNTLTRGQVSAIVWRMRNYRG